MPTDPNAPEWHESFMPTVEPSGVSDVELTPEHMAYALERWPDKSESMRSYNMRRSIWTRIQNRKPHPDDPTRRKMGGPQPRSDLKERKETGRALVQAFDDRQKEVVDAAFAPLAPGNDVMDRHKAAMNLAKHAREEKKEEREADEYARKTDDEVRIEFAAMLAEMIRSGEITMDQIIEGTATEITGDQDQIAA